MESVNFANLWHVAQMFSQISHTPEFLGKFGVKRCSLSTGGMVCPKKMGNKEVLECELTSVQTTWIEWKQNFEFRGITVTSNVKQKIEKKIKTHIEAHGSNSNSNDFILRSFPCFALRILTAHNLWHH